MQITSKLKYLLLVVIFLLPLLQANKGFGYEQIKVFFFVIGLTVCGILWIIYRTKQPLKKTWSGISKAAAFFIFVLFLTSLVGIDNFRSFVGMEPYFQGFVFYAYLYLFFLLILWLKIELNQWAYVLTSSSVLVSLIAIEQWIRLNIFYQAIPSYAGRVVSTFGQPNFYAGFLLLSLPFYYLIFKDTRKKISFFGMIGGLVCMVGILVSYSRSTILLALILLMLGLTAELKNRFKLGIIIFGIIIISILIALKFSSGLVGNEVAGAFLTKNPDLTKESVEKRAYIWPVTWQIIWQRPILGYGLENIDKAFSNYFSANKHPLFEENLNVSPVLISLKDLNINRSHNYFLDLLLFGGVAGLLAFLLLVYLLFKKLKTGKGLQNKVLLVALITYLIWVQFQNQSVVHLIYFWLLVGLIDDQKKQPIDMVHKMCFSRYR